MEAQRKCIIKAHDIIMPRGQTRTRTNAWSDAFLVKLTDK